MAVFGKNFLFIHIFKCGGMTVRDIINENDLFIEEKCQSHTIAKDIKHFMGTEYDKVFKFAFVRNPYRWLASTYFYIRRYETHDKHDEVRDQSLDWFIDWFIEQTKREYEIGRHRYCTMSEFLYDEDKLLVDFVGKVEDFDKDMNKVMTKIDLNWIPKDRFGKKNVNNIYDKFHLKRYYSDESINKIQKFFEKDFINFNYSMEVI